MHALMPCLPMIFSSNCLVSRTFFNIYSHYLNTLSRHWDPITGLACTHCINIRAGYLDMLSALGLDLSKQAFTLFKPILHPCSMDDHHSFIKKWITFILGVALSTFRWHTYVCGQPDGIVIWLQCALWVFTPCIDMWPDNLDHLSG